MGVAGRVFLYLRKGQFSYAFDTTYANLQQKHHETRAEECPKEKCLHFTTIKVEILV